MDAFEDLGGDHAATAVENSHHRRSCLDQFEASHPEGQGSKLGCQRLRARGQPFDAHLELHSINISRIIFIEEAEDITDLGHLLRWKILLKSGE